MDNLELLAALPGSITVGGKTYPVLPPTPGDQLREAMQMRTLARRAGQTNPLEYVAANAAALTPAGYAVAVAEAVKLAAQPAREPDAAAVMEQYGTPEGVRWRLYYHLARSGAKVTEAQVRELVTDLNCGCVCVALDDALRLPEGEGGKKPPPPTGTAG